MDTRPARREHGVRRRDVPEVSVAARDPAELPEDGTGSGDTAGGRAESLPISLLGIRREVGLNHFPSPWGYGGR